MFVLCYEDVSKAYESTLDATTQLVNAKPHNITLEHFARREPYVKIQ